MVSSGLTSAVRRKPSRLSRSPGAICALPDGKAVAWVRRWKSTRNWRGACWLVHSSGDVVLHACSAAEAIARRIISRFFTVSPQLFEIKAGGADQTRPAAARRGRPLLQELRPVHVAVQD